MIRVNGLSGLNFVSKPSFKAGLPTPSKIEEKEENSNLQGAEALAAYNFAIMNRPEVFDKIEPVKLILATDEEPVGEKIYNSEGKLAAIVKEDDKTKTIYTPNEDNEDLISTISVIDKKSGKTIKEQNNYFENDKNTGIWIREFAPINGEMTRSSYYEDGQLESATVYKHSPKGRTSISKEYDDNGYRIDFDSKNFDSHTSVELNNDKQITYYNEEKEINDLKYEEKSLSFYDGNLVSIYNSERITVPNSFGKDKIKNPELIPTPKYTSNIDLKSHEGEKSYYSNGAIEKNVMNNGEKIAYFDINGNLEKVKDGNAEITFDKNFQSIIENLDDNKTKTTKYFNDGSGSVEMKTENEYKKVYFNENLRPSSYEEGKFDENGDKDRNLSFDFNNKGMLTNFYDWS